jgi:hypothetical protein
VHSQPTRNRSLFALPREQAGASGREPAVLREVLPGVPEERREAMSNELRYTQYCYDEGIRLATENLRRQLALMESQRNAAMETEKRDAAKALDVLAGIGFVTPAETYGSNASWAISDLCRCVKDQAEQLAAKDEALKDKERMDWLESHIISSEPASYWSKIHQEWKWRWMGRNFDTLRSALDAALEAGKEGQ